MGCSVPKVDACGSVTSTQCTLFVRLVSPRSPDKRNNTGVMVENPSKSADTAFTYRFTKSALVPVPTGNPLKSREPSALTRASLGNGRRKKSGSGSFVRGNCQYARNELASPPHVALAPA